MAVVESNYRITLENLDPFRIGGVEDPLSGFHNPVARVGGRVCIPGASLKGAYRAKIEEFLIDTKVMSYNSCKNLN